MTLKPIKTGATLEERFNYRVIRSAVPTSCWGWNGSINNKGYAPITFLRRTLLAHRVSWFFEHGKWPEQWILHHCDNRICTNPQHLFEGDAQENMTDMVVKDRACFGEKHHNAILTTTAVIEIRKRYAAGETQTSLAAEFGVGRTAVSRACAGKTWRRVESDVTNKFNKGKR